MGINSVDCSFERHNFLSPKVAQVELRGAVVLNARSLVQVVGFSIAICPWQKISRCDR
jgi:hypothetical protein